MRNSARTTAAATVVMLAASCLVTAAEQDLPVERASFGRTTDAITLDGRLDEASWGSASPRTKFYEIYPANVGEPTVATRVAFLYDERNVYVGIRALDPNPESIRAPIVRRDQVLEDQDYVEILLDPLNTRRSATFFRVSARGIVTDGQYDDKSRLRDYSPDLDFDAATSIDGAGWTAEIRIALSSLRFRSGVGNRWAYIVYRNLPRTQVATMSTARMPRGENCDLCYADTLDGIAPVRNAALAAIPHLAYTRVDDNIGTSDDLNAGIDLTWKPRENTVVDATLFPDFSQVEADAPQLTANTQFALALTEKRPFFLEATDLLTTQVPVIYTRAFTDPDVGVRITDRSSRHEYTAMALRDAGGGTIIEPGPISSRTAPQDFASTALVGRNRFLLSEGSVGMLASARFNDDGSQNAVIGVDGSWTPSPADQITVQFLRSQTRNPNRPDLLDTWNGQRMEGSASSLGWKHNSDAWNANLTYGALSRGFRTWNGFVTQVGATSVNAIGNLYVYRGREGFVTRLGPSLTFMQVESDDGRLLGRSIGPGLSLRGARDTMVSLTWQPHARTTTLAGPRSYDSVVLGISTTPLPWIPHATLAVTAGEMVDMVTGALGNGHSVEASVPLRFSRFELNPEVGYQSLQSSDDGDSLFTERNLQLSAIWHLSTTLNLRVTHQESRLNAAAEFLGASVSTRTSWRLSSLLVSYQTSWRTQFFLGVLIRSERFRAADEAAQADQTQIFAKFTYPFSN